jgi:hypothetical protein
LNRLKVHENEILRFSSRAAIARKSPPTPVSIVVITFDFQWQVDTSTATQVTSRQQQQIITNQQAAPTAVQAGPATTTTQNPKVNASTTQITGTCPEALDKIFMSGAGASSPDPVA